MDNQNLNTDTENADKPELHGLPCSKIITAELTGIPIRQLSRNRLLRTGDRLCNKHGQELWSVEAFNPQGVQVMNHMTAREKNYTWEALYGFYERVSPNDPELAEDAS